MSGSKKRLIIVDGNSLLYRAFFGMRLFSTSDGIPTNAIYGLTMMLLKLMEEAPHYIAVAFDTPKPTFRHEEYDGYKAHRKAPPDELITQMPIARELIRAFNIPVLELPGFEADDIIGAVSKKAADEDIDVTIVTGDMDTLQLVNDRVSVMTTVKGVSDTVIYDYDAVVARYGLRPDQMIDYKGLKGDPSDNIPGVPGIGDKTAVSLLETYGTVEEVLSHLEEMKESKIKRNLIEHSELALLSKRLATIITDLPMDINLDEYSHINPDYGVLRDLFVRLEFKTLLRRLPEVKKAESAVPAIERTVLGVCRTITSEKELKELISAIKDHGNCAIHCYTSNSKTTTARLFGIAFSLGSGNTAYVPLESSAKSGGTFELVFDAPYEAEISDISHILSDESIVKYCHNYKLAYAILLRSGIDLRGVEFDTMLAAYLIDASRGSFDLSDISFDFLGLELPDSVGSDSDDSGLICAGAEAVYRLSSVLSARLERDGLTSLLNNLELPLASIIARMELNGIAVDYEELSILSSKIDTEISALEREIYLAAGEEFNIGSPKQLQAILFEKLGMKTSKKTKTGFSTSASALEEMAVEYPIVQDVLKYRELMKIKSTYADALPKLINPKTGRVHTSLNQTVAATGRLSSSDPNLQNIPIRTELGREIRKAFIAPDDCYLLSADYSQIEYRVLAHLTQDSWLVNAFENGVDIHLATASSLFGCPESEVTPEMRRRAKTINFAVMYGMADFTLSKELSTSVKDARKFIDDYFAKFPSVRIFTDQTIQDARETGFVTTILGRRRYVPDVNNSNYNIRSAAERAVVNTPIQGAAADIIKLAMITADRELKKAKLKSRMLLQVHDELLFEVPSQELDIMVPLVRNAMEHAYKMLVPLDVEVKFGKNWSEMEKI